MKKVCLQKMTDFVLENSICPPIEEYNKVNETFVNKVINYVNFLKQPLELRMFVPCDEYGNVLEEPVYDPSNEQYWSSEFFQFQKVK